MAKKKVYQKMSVASKTLLVRMRKLKNLNSKSLRRAFKTPELSSIKSTPWGKFSLDKSDINLIEQVKHLVGPTIALRKKNRSIKKRNAKTFFDKRNIDVDTGSSMTATAKQRYLLQQQEANCGMAGIYISEQTSDVAQMAA